MEEDIKILEELKQEYSKGLDRLNDKDLSGCMAEIYKCRKKQVQAIENLIKGYKEKEEDLKLHEKTSFEFQEENIKLNKVINKMAEFMAGGNYYNYATKEMVIKEFMEEVEDG